MRVAFLTHEPFYPPSGGGSAEAPYLVRELVRRGHSVHLFCPDFPDRDAVAAQFGVAIHPFTGWAMGRYARARNLKYLLYPAALGRLVRRTLLRQQRQARAEFHYDVLLAQHTIAAVAAGRLRRRLGTPVVLNFLDYLTGFMETWPAPFTKTGLVGALNRFELALPRRYDVEGVMTVSEPLADRFAATGYPRERLQPILYGYDAAQFRPAPEPPPADARPVVVMHGSFDRHHLGGLARAAVTAVARARPETEFRFVGRATPGLARFAADVRAAVPAIRLNLTGFVPYAEVAGQLRGPDPVRGLARHALRLRGQGGRVPGLRPAGGEHAAREPAPAFPHRAGAAVRRIRRGRPGARGPGVAGHAGGPAARAGRGGGGARGGGTRLAGAHGAGGGVCGNLRFPPPRRLRNLRPRVTARGGRFRRT
jgi:glycosyltransferase involved in cell wall biosynthesis